MDIEIKSEKNTLIVSPRGDIDLSNSNELGKILVQKIGEGRLKVVVDFSQVGYIDSSGIGVIVQAYRILKEKEGEVILAGCNENIFRIFKLVNFHRFLKITKTLQEALPE